jgi:hypothetical protein
MAVKKVTRRVVFLATEEQHAVWTRAAEKEGRVLSQWMRRVLTLAAGKRRA